MCINHLAKLNTPLSRPATALCIKPLNDSVAVGCSCGCGATITFALALMLPVLVMFSASVSAPVKTYVPAVLGSYAGVPLSQVIANVWVELSDNVTLIVVGRFAEARAVP